MCARVSQAGRQARNSDTFHFSSPRSLLVCVCRNKTSCMMMNEIEGVCDTVYRGGEVVWYIKILGAVYLLPVLVVRSRSLAINFIFIEWTKEPPHEEPLQISEAAAVGYVYRAAHAQSSRCVAVHSASGIVNVNSLTWTSGRIVTCNAEFRENPRKPVNWILLGKERQWTRSFPQTRTKLQKISFRQNYLKNCLNSRRQVCAKRRSRRSLKSSIFKGQK